MCKCATSSLGTAVPVSFMALFDDAAMYTYTVLGVHEEGAEQIPGNPHSRLFLTKAVRVLSFAPVEVTRGGGGELGAEEEGGLGAGGDGDSGDDEEPDGYLSRFFRELVGSTVHRSAQHNADNADDADDVEDAADDHPLQE